MALRDASSENQTANFRNNNVDTTFGNAEAMLDNSNVMSSNPMSLNQVNEVEAAKDTR